MPSETLIEANGLTKTYQIWQSPTSRLAAPILQAASSLLPGTLGRSLKLLASEKRRDFHALNDVSFRIRRGEATGIIGRNGSGKSTLLQLIAGTLAPTEGSVSVQGRISALLELGSGFNPDFTGRENVFLNGAVYGFKRDEIAAKMSEITAFADIGEFIDQPVRTYSSGMMMRLAFAVAVHVQPDVLIIDEALAVGDVFFSQKCFQRIREIVHRGATLIFVSHDMGAVQSLCDRALMLHQGRLVFDGTPEDCVSRYFNLHKPVSKAGDLVPGTHPAVDPGTRESIVKGDILGGAKSRHGEKALEIVAATAVDGHGLPTWEYEMMHRMTVRVLLKANASIDRPSAGLQLHDRMGNLVFAAGTTQLQFSLPSFKAGQEVALDFRVTLSLYPGLYTLSLDAAEFDAVDPNLGNFHDRIGGLGPIVVSRNEGGVFPFYGIAQLQLEVSYG